MSVRNYWMPESFGKDRKLYGKYRNYMYQTVLPKPTQSSTDDRKGKVVFNMKKESDDRKVPLQRFGLESTDHA